MQCGSPCVRLAGGNPECHDLAALLNGQLELVGGTCAAVWLHVHAIILRTHALHNGTAMVEGNKLHSYVMHSLQYFLLLQLHALSLSLSLSPLFPLSLSLSLSPLLYPQPFRQWLQSTFTAPSNPFPT